jgi:hypothetical protein
VPQATFHSWPLIWAKPLSTLARFGPNDGADSGSESSNRCWKGLQSRRVQAVAEDEPMTDWYFEGAEIGTTSKAGPYLVSKHEIIQFAKQYDPVPRHVDEEAAARSILGD